VNLPANLQASLQLRFRYGDVGPGGLTDVPELQDPPDPETIVGTRFALTYDTRDLTDIPTRGLFADVGVEIVDQGLGSSSSYVKYGLEGKAFFPLTRSEKYVLALHADLDYMHNGENAVFYEQNIVGGKYSLRGYGRRRFTDVHRFVLQGEVRSNVYERELFGVNAHLEVAPFIDLAKVFNSATELPLENLHPVGGLGFRGVVVPQVVAFVDFGIGEEGTAGFTGIDYPF
jgi:outer membrane protein assembly factor BamA